MDVRQARPTDAPLVLALALDDHSHIVRGTKWPETGAAVGTILSSILPIPTPGHVWVARDGASSALLEARPRHYVIGWDITRLALRGGDAAMLEAIVQAATSHVQRRGIPRLFARCDDRALDTLQALEFRPIAREIVLTGGTSPAGDGLAPPAGSRYRAPQDAWPLHQLANTVTPTLVRQLEGSTSLEWTERPRKMTEIVVERDGQIVAWIGWHARARHGRIPIGLVVHPDHDDLALDLLYHALAQAPPSARFITRVREYHESALQAFVDAGFQTVARETLTMKHGLLIAEPARQPARAVGIPTIPVSPIAVGAGSPLAPVRHVAPLETDIYRRKIQGDRCTRGIRRRH